MKARLASIYPLHSRNAFRNLVRFSDSLPGFQLALQFFDPLQCPAHIAVPQIPFQPLHFLRYVLASFSGSLPYGGGSPFASGFKYGQALVLTGDAEGAGEAPRSGDAADAADEYAAGNSVGFGDEVQALVAGHNSSGMLPGDA